MALLSEDEKYGLGKNIVADFFDERGFIEYKTIISLMVERIRTFVWETLLHILYWSML